MIRTHRHAMSSITCCLFLAIVTPTVQAGVAEEILRDTGVQGGFVVHLGCGDGALTVQLRANSSYQVLGLDVDEQQVAEARKRILASGQYGDVTVDRLAGKDLPLVDNLANLVVAEDRSGVSMDEIRRVLAPQGVAYVKTAAGWEKTVKPRPANIDEWTHYLHDAGGNAVAHDDVVAPPRHLQWLGSPRWSRHHDRMASMSAMVSAGGRVFYIMDEGSRVSIQLPPKWKLIARDAFNGTILWKQEIKTWHNHLWPLKSGPTQLTRRLVASGNRVYATLGIHDPLTVMDAATGEILFECDDSTSTEEIIVSGETILALVNKGESIASRYAPAHNVGDQRRVYTEFLWNEQPREVTAYDGASGKKLWRHEATVAPLTLATDGERTYFHDGDKVVALEMSTGEVAWSSRPLDRRRSVPLNFGPKLVVTEGVVLFAGGDRSMTALNAKTGKPMWTSPHARGSYMSPEDLLVVSGLVWSAPTTSSRDSGVWTGRDLQTGEVKIEFPPNVKTYWFHHRCYIAKATDRFLLPSRTGIEFVDYAKQDWDINHWVRGGCLYGIMPCNGMVYAPPHNCACYPEAKLYGINALAPESAGRALPKNISDAGRWQKGPAVGMTPGASQVANDWPTYRGNTARSGSTPQSISTKLQPGWTANLGGKLSQLAIADGKVFVAQVDQHSVHALDQEDGKRIWSRTVGGRVDSPPTFDRGRVLFGSADGYVYCLRADDGALVWRFRAAPEDRPLMSVEQLD